MEYTGHTSILHTGSLELAQKVASIFPAPRIARLPPELTEPYPCENCHLINACKESGAECKAFKTYATRLGTWNPSDVGHFKKITGEQRKAIKAHLNP